MRFFIALCWGVQIQIEVIDESLRPWICSTVAGLLLEPDLEQRHRSVERWVKHVSPLFTMWETGSVQWLLRNSPGREICLIWTQIMDVRTSKTMLEIELERTVMIRSRAQTRCSTATIHRWSAVRFATAWRGKRTSLSWHFCPCAAGSGPYCDTSVDGIGTCWPKSGAGHMVSRPCPEMFYGVRYNTTSKSLPPQATAAKRETIDSKARFVLISDTDTPPPTPFSPLLFVFPVGESCLRNCVHRKLAWAYKLVRKEVLANQMCSQSRTDARHTSADGKEPRRWKTRRKYGIMLQNEV